jgi:hypothetical protein
MDIGRLHEDILSAHKANKHSSNTLSALSNTRWSVDDQGLLCYDDCIWVPDSDNLCLWILLNNRDHPTVPAGLWQHLFTASLVEFPAVQ